MLRTDENETEILLGNKQLLGIFLVVAVLLGIAFTGGYMAGRGSGRKAAVPSGGAVDAAHSDTGTGGQTHTLSPDAGKSPDENSSETSAGKDQQGPDAARTETSASEQPLGSRRHSGPKMQPIKEARPQTTEGDNSPASLGNYTPQSGSQYLQVTAVGRDEAVGLADVLHKKGFRAHAVPKPGNNKLYRVIVGPIRDAGDLRSTRDALHNVGFREVIVQHY